MGVSKKQKVHLCVTEFLTSSHKNPIQNMKAYSILDLLVKSGFVVFSKRH